MRRRSTVAATMAGNLAATVAAIFAFGPLLAGFGLFEKRDGEIEAGNAAPKIERSMPTHA